MTDRLRSKARHQRALPDGYQYGDGASSCFFCGRDLAGAVRVTMGETEPLFFCVACEDCAKRPYPLAEVSRTQPPWRPPHENAAERLRRRAAATTLDIHAGEH